MAGEIALSRWKRLVTGLPLSCLYYSKDPNASLSEKSRHESGTQAALEFRLFPHIPQTCQQFAKAKGKTWSSCIFCHFNICSRTDSGLHTQQKASSQCSHCCLSLLVLPFSYILPLLSLHKFPLILPPFSFLPNSKLSVPVVSFSLWPPLH